MNNNPVNGWDWYGFKAGDLFDTPDEAAYDFGRTYNEVSISENLEYGSVIYTEKTSTGKIVYSYYDPSKSNPKAPHNCTISADPKDGQSLYSIVHTHGAFSFKDEIPGPNDRDNVKVIPNNPIYLVTPGGKLLKFTADPDEDIIIAIDLPRDPNFPDRDDRGFLNKLFNIFFGIETAY